MFVRLDSSTEKRSANITMHQSRKQEFYDFRKCLGGLVMAVMGSRHGIKIQRLIGAIL